MGNAISAIITWIVMVVVVCTFILTLPFWIVCALIFRDREPIRMPSIVAFLAADFVCLGWLTGEYTTPIKCPWRQEWQLKKAMRLAFRMAGISF